MSRDIFPQDLGSSRPVYVAGSPYGGMDRRMDGRGFIVKLYEVVHFLYITGMQARRKANHIGVGLDQSSNFHPRQQNIWGQAGPRRRTVPAYVRPRGPAGLSHAHGKQWLSLIEVRRWQRSSRPTSSFSSQDRNSRRGFRDAAIFKVCVVYHVSRNLTGSFFCRHRPPFGVEGQGAPSSFAWIPDKRVPYKTAVAGRGGLQALVAGLITACPFR